jgi:hypothetical protein
MLDAAPGWAPPSAGSWAPSVVAPHAAWGPATDGGWSRSIRNQPPVRNAASDENEGRSVAVPPRRRRLCTATEEDRAAAAMFHHGYLEAKAGIHIIDVTQIDGNVSKVMGQCATSPGLTVPQAFRQAFRSRFPSR